jgi:hypothetical protein
LYANDHSFVLFTEAFCEFSCTPFRERGRSFEVDNYLVGFERMMGRSGNQKVVDVAIIANRIERRGRRRHLDGTGKMKKKLRFAGLPVPAGCGYKRTDAFHSSSVTIIRHTPPMTAEKQQIHAIKHFCIFVIAFCGFL